MQNTIQRRFVVATSLITLSALLISATATVVYNLRNYRATTAEELNANAAILARAVTPALQFNNPTAAESYLSLMEDQPRILAAAIYDVRGNLFAAYNPDRVPRMSSHLSETDTMLTDSESAVVVRRIVGNNEILGFLYLRMQYTFLQNLAGNVVIAIAVMLLAMVIAVVFSMQTQRSITRPLRSVADLARRFIETKNYSLRAEQVGDGEVAYLVGAINNMLDEIEAARQSLEIKNRDLGIEVKERRATEESLRESEERFRQLNTELEQRVAERTRQYEIANRELESFSYSVSHDLRSPLRAIDGFSQALLEDYQDKLDETGKNYLLRVRAGAQRMGLLIDDMLKLSRVSRASMNLRDVDLSEMARQIVEELGDVEPGRKVAFSQTSQLHAHCDPHLIRIALTNLLGNAWKYSAKSDSPEIEFGLRQIDGEPVYFVQDNGVGFDMAYADKLFGAFQRLHPAGEFAGTGIGLATAKRVISRHGGRIWAHAEPGKGAVFYFTLPPTAAESMPDNGEENEYQTHSARRRQSR